MFNVFISVIKKKKKALDVESENLVLGIDSASCCWATLGLSFMLPKDQYSCLVDENDNINFPGYFEEK